MSRAEQVVRHPQMQAVEIGLAVPGVRLRSEGFPSTEPHITVCV